MLQYNLQQVLSHPFRTSKAGENHRNISKPIPSHPKMDAAMNDGNQAAARDAAQDEAQRAEAAPQIETISVVVRPIKVIHSTK
ncbi:hypothetical protein PGT21_006382 [Puccinia graminis f. sp. tritici]|uniref:Uncharacterized protein n=1 Tax=Puccinia graminis f. sp. tritici TaxID=56615 RepID=A0A5B0M3S2_PUCGR|nr:hypothetical protein PGT21_006382 [Puccinia graminis f. sp. tritici]